MVRAHANPRNKPAPHATSHGRFRSDMVLALARCWAAFTESAREDVAWFRDQQQQERAGCVLFNRDRLCLA